MGHPRYYELLNEMKRIHDIKNSDYARTEDPLSNFRMVESLNLSTAVEGVLVRMTDKLSRMVNLVKKKGVHAVEESFTDTALDLSNYSLIAAILFEEKLKTLKKRKKD